jgi:DNA-binding NtrC family response regulator
MEPMQGNSSKGATPVRFRLLLVDDDPAVLESLRDALADYYEVEVASAAERALVMLGQSRFDVVCADYGLPGQDGLTFLEEVQRRFDPIGVMLMTGVPEKLQAEPKERRDAVTVVEKPCDAMRLIRLVGQLGRLVEIKRSLLSIRLRSGRG